VRRIISFGADCLAGVPSIIFGLFGFIFFVITLHLGWSILSGARTLAVMILPTIIRTSEEAIKAVPKSYREISYSLGGGKLDTIIKVVLPTAIPGILTGIILGMGRAVGETAATIFTTGASLNMPTSLFSSSRTLAVHFYILAREGISMPKAYGTATVLIIIILLINFIAYRLMHRFMARYY
jgi:phosphate transport system permease protein